MSSYVCVQRLVDSYFIAEFSGVSSATDTLKVGFQSFPSDDWTYSPTKFFLLGTAFQW